MSKLSFLIKPAVTLACVCLVTTALLAAVNSVTSPIITAAADKAATEARSAVLSQANGEFDEIGTDGMPAEIIDAYRAKNGSGYVFTLTSKGYGGDITIICGINSDGTVNAAQTLSHSETSGIGSRVVADESYYSQYFGKTEDNYSEVDAISGATISSKAYQKAVKTAFEAFDKAKEGAN